MKIATRLLFLLSVFTCINGQAEPLADFKKIVNQCKQAFDSRPAVEVSFNENSKSWTKRIHAPATMTYDVRKTDSLVSPIVGWIEIIDVNADKEASDEQAAQSLEVSSSNYQWLGRVVRRINYAFADGQWDVVDGSMDIGVKRPTDASFNNNPGQTREKRDSLFRQKGPIKSCLFTKK